MDFFSSHKTDYEMTLSKKNDCSKYLHDNKWIKTHSLPPVNVLFKHTGSEKDKWNTHYTNAWWINVDINSSKNTLYVKEDCSAP